jgi:AcrR family transcriptional regulator
VVEVVVARSGRYGQILESFTRHVAEDGYDGTNLGAIAAELGVSKGTIVHHFGTKERILAALHESYMQRRLVELELIVERLSGPEVQLAALLHAFVYYQVEDRAATVAFQREIVRLADEEAMAEGRALRARYLARVQGIVQSGVDSGVFRLVNADVDVLLMFGTAQWAWTWFRPDGARSVGEIGTALVDMVLGGLLVDRGGLAELAAADGAAAAAMRAAVRDAAERASAA